METLKISLYQTDIAWEDPSENLNRVYEALTSVKNNTDLLVLPEMFSTGFTMNSESLAEPANGPTIIRLKELSAEFGIALTGSFIAEEGGKYYNRGFFITPEKHVSFYDKRHLFRMGDEINHFSAGNSKMIVNYRGWNICLLICYDLRFPVWSRNVNNEYDLLVYVGNWPASRRLVWDALLPARALENMCYVCAVNRVGTDGNNLTYDGGSIVWSPRGEVVGRVPDDTEGIVTIEADLQSLWKFRDKFPVWKDADPFTI